MHDSGLFEVKGGFEKILVCSVLVVQIYTYVAFMLICLLTWWWWWWENTTGRNGNMTKELVQLVIFLDCQSNVTGHNAALLVITSCVSSELQDFCAQVLQHCVEVDRGSRSHTLELLARFEVSTNTTNRELQSSFGRRADSLLLATASFSFSRHG
jgi:hypothetical protein